MTPVEIARTFLPSAERPMGTPWFHQGRSRHGMDCLGLARVCYAGYGIRDETNYSQNPSDGTLERGVSERFGPPVAIGVKLKGVPENVLRVNDLVVMAFPRVVRHVGIVGDHPDGFSLIHTDSMLKRVTEHRLDIHWLRRIRFVHRLEAYR